MPKQRKLITGQGKYEDSLNDCLLYKVKSETTLK